MYTLILVPVDLRHVERLKKALKTAADLSSHYGIPVCYTGVSSSAPGTLGHTPEEYAERLKAFASAEGKANGIETTAHAVISNDPSIDLDATLLKAVTDTGADLVVMASHIPNIADHLWPSNGGTIAARSAASVFVVRGE
ncbi:universal stress protein [Stappia sp.]|uniref:universal stress protein n=1 Tax=Stappia sp. TaxID=1870903 RepID=UPI003A98D7D3